MGLTPLNACSVFKIKVLKFKISPPGGIFFFNYYSNGQFSIKAEKCCSYCSLFESAPEYNGPTQKVGEWHCVKDETIKSAAQTHLHSSSLCKNFKHKACQVQQAVGPHLEMASTDYTNVTSHNSGQVNIFCYLSFCYLSIQ